MRAGRPGERARTGLASARTRFARRAARARRRPRVLALGLVLVLAVVGGMVWLGWFSTVLAAERVEVRGVSKAQADVVRKVAQVPLGGPLMRVDTAAVTDRIEQDRRWARVTVSRSLPHTVTVEVTPRVAVLAIRTPSGQVELVDREGVVFRTVSAVPDTVPLVSATTGSVGRPGVQAALQALGALDKSVLRAVTGVSISGADQVTMSLRHDASTRTVVWGGVGDAEVKARLVAILLEQEGSTIDVSVPASPVTR